MTTVNTALPRAVNQCFCNVMNLWLFFIPEPNYQQIFDDYLYEASKMYVLPEFPGI